MIQQLTVPQAIEEYLKDKDAASEINQFGYTGIARNINRELLMDRYSIEYLRKEVAEYVKYNIEDDSNSVVLVIPDLHFPFELKGFLDFVKRLRDQIKPDRIVFIGDIIDNHYTSFHAPADKFMGANKELELCIEKVQQWYKEFPVADVCIGNHDIRVHRKAVDSKIDLKWIRDFSEVLNTPNWNFVESVEIDNVLYQHGSNGDAKKVALYRGKSVVQGHYHTKMFIEYIRNGIWGMQVGTGIDRDSYAFGYAKGVAKEQLLGCGVVNGGVPMIMPYYVS